MACESLSCSCCSCCSVASSSPAASDMERLHLRPLCSFARPWDELLRFPFLSSLVPDRPRFLCTLSSLLPSGLARSPPFMANWMAMWLAGESGSDLGPIPSSRFCRASLLADSSFFSVSLSFLVLVSRELVRVVAPDAVPSPRPSMALALDARLDDSVMMVPFSSRCSTYHAFLGASCLPPRPWRVTSGCRRMKTHRSASPAESARESRLLTNFSMPLRSLSTRMLFFSSVPIVLLGMAGTIEYLALTRL
mmetsp:Transcript_56363/g.138342  ORF Transcript_56363/g.138342 Transcript_56363/m.138342 type:complete len:250 (-) Transcript_56363:341-1090(-)